MMQVYDFTPNKRHLELTIEHISTLALAYFFTADLKYAQRAREKAAAWFLNPETAMIAKYAGRLAAVRRGGTAYGRPEGVYDMARLPDLLNGAILLASSSVWSDADTQAMVACVSNSPFLLDCFSAFQRNYSGQTVRSKLCKTVFSWECSMEPSMLKLYSAGLCLSSGTINV
jgi:Alginate lyase